MGTLAWYFLGGVVNTNLSWVLIFIKELGPLAPLALAQKISLWATGSSHVVVAILLTSEVDAICRDLAPQKAGHVAGHVFAVWAVGLKIWIDFD
jgi:hypothetical protein